MGPFVDTTLYPNAYLSWKTTVPLSANPIGTSVCCVYPQHRSPIVFAVLELCVALGLSLLLLPASASAESDHCDAPPSDCVAVRPLFAEMGCISQDRMDLTVGSDSMPGIMSHCQCQDCNSTRFANQFYNPRTDCEAYQPRWRATSSFFALARVTPSPGVLVRDSTNPIRQINRDSFKFDWAPGIELSMKRIEWNENSFELRFMGFDTLTANAATPAGGTAEITATPPVFVSDITSIEASYRSDLYSIEANWQFVTYKPFQYIAGIRYIGFNERLNTEFFSTTSPATCRTTTHNDLYGVQVGVTSVPDMPLLDCRWLTWSAKLGLYGNDAEQTSILTGTVGQRADSPADTASFAGEFNIGMEIPLTTCIRVSGGYTLFLLERVAVATDQLEVTNFFMGTGSDDQGNALFHGGRFALTLMF